jgi:V8-like Glu-specific endopeptidase
MSPKPRHPALPALVACFAVLAMPAVAQADSTAIGSPASASARRALRFWTPARMRSARPLVAQPPSRGGLAYASAAPAPRSEGAEPGTTAFARADFATVADPTAPGFRQNGAIFAVIPRFGTARCSGTAVDSPNRSVVITAGHCVHELGRWFDSDWVFVPGYHDGVRPFGVFVARWLGSTRPWIHGGSENGDVGAAVVGRNERGQLLGAAVGGDRIAFDRSPRQLFDVHGYPVAAPFNGATQRLCAGTPYLGHDVASFLWTGPLNLALTCDVTGGASGGGWTIEGDVLNGVTDYGYGDDPTTDFGAYFGGAVRDLYERAAAVR